MFAILLLSSYFQNVLLYLFIYLFIFTWLVIVIVSSGWIYLE